MDAPPANSSWYRRRGGRRLVPVFGLDVDNEPLGQFGKGIIIDAIADGARLTRRDAAAGPRAFPRPFWMGLTDPAAIVASRAEPHGF